LLRQCNCPGRSPAGVRGDCPDAPDPGRRPQSRGRRSGAGRNAAGRGQARGRGGSRSRSTPMIVRLARLVLGAALVAWVADWWAGERESDLREFGLVGPIRSSILIRAPIEQVWDALV